MAQQYQNTHFLDYSADEAFAANLDLWWNGGHLNINGANLLSEKIGIELASIIKDKK